MWNLDILYKKICFSHSLSLEIETGVSLDIGTMIITVLVSQISATLTLKVCKFSGDLNIPPCTCAYTVVTTNFDMRKNMCFWKTVIPYRVVLGNWLNHFKNFLDTYTINMPVETACYNILLYQ